MKSSLAFRSRKSAASKANQRGVSIIAVLLGLVVSALVIAVAYNMYTDSQGKARIEKAIAEITTMTAEAQKMYGGSNNYGSVTTAVAVQGGVVPPRLRIAGTNTAENTYNGAITFAPATITTANDALTLGYAGVLPQDCQKVVFAVESLMRGISIGATDIKANDAALNVATMATECDAAAPVTLNLRFGRQ